MGSLERSLMEQDGCQVAQLEEAINASTNTVAGSWSGGIFVSCLATQDTVTSILSNIQICTPCILLTYQQTFLMEGRTSHTVGSLFVTMARLRSTASKC